MIQSSKNGGRFLMVEVNIEEIANIAQKGVSLVPVIILGSGASAPHGIRSMTALADYLSTNLKPEGKAESEAWGAICSSLDIGLESALQKTPTPNSLVVKIVNLTWEAIAIDDLKLLQQAARGEVRFPLSRMIQGLFKSTSNTLNIVTPNYDRIVEYASDLSDVVHTTGFVPGIIRRREGTDSISMRRGAHPVRTVKIWKVHGSLDWFKDPFERIVSLPLAHALPERFTPLIVTPGNSKYELTHFEPFRSAIQGSDTALDSANSFLCVGYGFRDQHIHPKLAERCSRFNVPITVLSRTLTDEAKHFLEKRAGTAYLAMEQYEKGTRVFTHAKPKGTVIPNTSLWSFEEFNNLVFGAP